MTASTWLLLIYTIPAEPSRKRAYIWRALKKAGAVSLRDGVWVLPEHTDTVATAWIIAEKVEEFDGQVTLVEGASIGQDRAESIIAESRAERAVEYDELTREAEGFLEHVQRESEHRELSFTDLAELEEDLDKLKHWAAQVQGRDYFGSEGSDRVRDLLARCEEAFGTFLDNAFQRDEGTQ